MTAEMGVLVALFLLVARRTVADLPVDCPHDKILGEWEVTLASGQYDKTVRCASPEGLSLSFYGSGFRSSELGKCASELTSPDVTVLTLKVSEPNKCKAVEGENEILGTWTSVYNEGWLVKLDDDRSFLFFSLFDKHSDGGLCHATWPGEVRKTSNPDAHEWGCAVAMKKGTEDSTACEVVAKAVDTYGADAVTSLLESESSSATYQTHKAWLSELNSKQRSFRVGEYDFLERLTVAQAQKLLGATRRRARATVQREKERINLDALGLPRAFSWRCRDGADWVDPVIMQHCGSCYSVSSTSLINSRLRILTGLDCRPNFDYQQVLQCNRYDQGCAGGYPFLTLKYFAEYGLVLDATDCPIDATPHDEHGYELALKSAAPVVRAKDYGYVGGFYGNVTAAAILRELVDNGPVVIGVGGAGPDLLHYKEGIYSASPEAPGGNHPLYTFESVSHAVLITGYETVCEKKDDCFVAYEIKNSWGSSWGEAGYFRLHEDQADLYIAGTDTAHSESLATWASVELVDGDDWCEHWKHTSKPKCPSSFAGSVSASSLINAGEEEVGRAILRTND